MIGDAADGFRSPLSLPQEDWRVGQFVSAHPFLTREQLMICLDITRDAIDKRLARLRKASIVDYTPICQQERPVNVCVPGDRAMDYIAIEAPSVLVYRRYVGLAGNPLRERDRDWEHLLAVNQFFVSAFAGVRWGRIFSRKLSVDWQADVLCKRTISIAGQDIQFAPDGILSIRHLDRGCTWVCEMVRTKHHQALVKQIRIFLAVLDRGAKVAGLLFVCMDEDAQQRTEEAFFEALRHFGRRYRALFTTERQVARHGALGCIWTIGGERTIKRSPVHFLSEGVAPLPEGAPWRTDAIPRFIDAFAGVEQRTTKSPTEDTKGTAVASDSQDLSADSDDVFASTSPGRVMAAQTPFGVPFVGDVSAADVSDSASTAPTAPHTLPWGLAWPEPSALAQNQAFSLSQVGATIPLPTRVLDHEADSDVALMAAIRQTSGVIVHPVSHQASLYFASEARRRGGTGWWMDLPAEVRRPAWLVDPLIVAANIHIQPAAEVACRWGDALAINVARQWPGEARATLMPTWSMPPGYALERDMEALFPEIDICPLCEDTWCSACHGYGWVSFAGPCLPGPDATPPPGSWTCRRCALLPCALCGDSGWVYRSETGRLARPWPRGKFRRPRLSPCSPELIARAADGQQWDPTIQRFAQAMPEPAWRVWPRRVIEHVF
ncbi:MAG: replication-relaxation family protein [Chloroflexota bacterium]